MEKLEKLLKEFWIETQWDKKLYKVVYWERWFEFWYQPYVWAKLEKTWELQDESLISKSFWFIKRLVDNDNIDFDIVKADTIRPIRDNMNKYTLEDYTRYERVLMLLSIQDNPIEFLISILK